MTVRFANLYSSGSGMATRVQLLQHRLQFLTFPCASTMNMGNGQSHRLPESASSLGVHN
jgi:hypothetical protein